MNLELCKCEAAGCEHEWMGKYTEIKDYSPENCRECGAPFNNANPSRSGLCAACEVAPEPDNWKELSGFEEQERDDGISDDWRKEQP